MKLTHGLLIAGVIVGLGALLFWGYRAASAPLPDGFPLPTAKGDVEIKQYPAYRAATVQVRGDLANAPSRGFSPLFRHISDNRSEEHTSELQSLTNLVCRLLLEKKKKT